MEARARQLAEEISGRTIDDADKRAAAQRMQMQSLIDDNRGLMYKLGEARSQVDGLKKRSFPGLCFSLFVCCAGVWLSLLLLFFSADCYMVFVSAFFSFVYLLHSTAMLPYVRRSCSEKVWTKRKPREKGARSKQPSVDAKPWTRIGGHTTGRLGPVKAPMADQTAEQRAVTWPQRKAAKRPK